MGRVAQLLLLVLLMPTILAQVPELAPVTDPVLGEALDIVIPQAENETSEDLSSEEIYLGVDLNVANAEFDLVGLLFGGGKVQVDATGDVHLEFRALGMERLDQALQASTGEANATVSGTFGVPVNRTALTAEELRLIGGGALLAAFQGMQEELTKSLVESMVPGMTVLSAEFKWSNTLPAHDLRQGNIPFITDPTNATQEGVPGVALRDPPLVLDAFVRIQLLDRLSLAEILQMAEEAEEEKAADNETAMGWMADEEEELKKEIEAEQQDSIIDRRAFEVLGYGQLLDVTIPAGWRIDLTLTVPDGYTIEGATDAFILASDHRSVTYQLDGSSRTEVSAQAGIVTLSNRFLITTVLLVVVLLVGYVLRTLTEMGTLRVVYMWQHRRGLDPNHRPRWWTRLKTRKQVRQSKQRAREAPQDQ